MNEKTKADLTPQGIYDYLMPKPADIKGFAKDFKIAFKVQLDRPQNAQYFLKTGKVQLDSTLLGAEYFKGDARDESYRLLPPYEDWLNQNNWDVTYNYPSGSQTTVLLKPIKPIKK